MHHRRDIVGRAEPFHRDILNQPLLALLPHRFPLTLGGRIGADEARRDVVDRDVPRSEFVRELTRQADLPGLGARVSLNASQADAETGAAGDVDDPAVAFLLHAGRNRLRHEECAGQIDVEDGLPILLRDLFKRAAELAAHAAGIVDQNVDCPGVWLDRRDRGLHRVAVTDVHDMRAAESAA